MGCKDSALVERQWGYVLVGLNPLSLEWEDLSRFPLDPRQEFPLLVNTRSRLFGSAQLQATVHTSSDGRDWAALPNMANPCQIKLGLCTMGDSIAAVGGQHGRSGNNLNTVERYSLVEGKWQMLPNMVQERCMPGVTIWHGKLTVVGGANSAGALNTVELYDPEMGTWDQLPPLRYARRAPTVAVVGDLLVVAGGFAVCPPLYTWDQVQAVEMYDLEDGYWRLWGDCKDHVCAIVSLLRYVDVGVDYTPDASTDDISFEVIVDP